MMKITGATMALTWPEIITAGITTPALPSMYFLTMDSMVSMVVQPFMIRSTILSTTVLLFMIPFTVLL
jgi:hypothetical protein